MTEPRGRSASREQIRRRRLVAIVAAIVIAALVAVVAAVAGALPHHHHPAAVTAPPAPPKPFRIVFPEGFNRVQMATRVAVVAKIAERKSDKPVSLARASYLAATHTVVVPCFTPHKREPVEGFLFPATYPFFAKTPSRALVRQQVVAFCQNWAQLNLSYAKSKNLTSYDVLKIASMIEKEAAVPAERPLIAAVIYNRLKARMTLGIDATLRYGLNIPPTQSILESQLQSSSPYNTRNHFGLPPTPIANPGLASLEAAAHPAHVNYLYFVRKPDKIHNFFTASATAFAHYECAHGYGC